MALLVVASMLLLGLALDLPGLDGGHRVAMAWGALATIALMVWWMLKALTQHLQASHAHLKQRTDALLSLAAEACFELDAQGLLLTLYLSPGSGSGFMLGEQDVGQRLWDLPGIAWPANSLGQLQACLSDAEPCHSLPLQFQAPGEPLRYLLLSATPLPRSADQPAVHWCLLQDVTREEHAREALKLTESRFHDLFRRVPTPLVIHREGIVLDANPVAVAQFGFTDLGSMIGRDILDLYEAGDSRQRGRQRLRELAGLPPGQALPPTEYRLTPANGKPMVAQVMSVTVTSLDHQPETLSIYIDNTERRQSEEALQRSEAMLSHLVANSPDVVTLTEQSSGRYAMVNPTFCRVTGYAMDEVIGKTSLELGMWTDPNERARFSEQLTRDGKVYNTPISFTVRNGTRLLLLVSAASFVMDGRDYIIINARDITASEQARLEREAILENALVGIALTREDCFMLTNPRFDQMLGWPRGALVGQPASVVFPAANGDGATGRLIASSLATGGQIEVEHMLLRRDGSQVLCRLQAKAVDPNHPSRGGTIWLAEDATERHQAEVALAKARDDAEAASRAKSAFLANTSHEIRTPLNALLGLARLARQPALDESRRQQYVEQISESAQTLSGILSDILDLSKIEAGKMHLDDVSFDLHELLQSLKRAYGALADTKGLSLTIELDDDLPQAVHGDPVRVRQILSNFLNNALKFTHEGQLQLVAQVIRPGLTRFEVLDTGPGIAESVQADLFHPFAQADTSVTRSFGGTGLGLSICRELAELMGGKVGVVSVLGQGSCFWAELPLPLADEVDRDAISSGGGADAISGARVLMVEDNAVNMMIAVALLEQWGASVAQAGNGAEAIAAVDSAVAAGHPFDVVLMDVQMPGMSGHEATRMLRQRFDARQLPIVALTAAALVSERNLAMAAGMNDFLTKPIDAQRLRHTLSVILRQHPHGD